MLAGTGNEDAKRVIAALDTQNELVQNRRKENGQSLPMPESEAKALMAGASLAVEARYEALSRFMQKENCKASTWQIRQGKASVSTGISFQRIYPAFALRQAV